VLFSDLTTTRLYSFWQAKFKPAGNPDGGGPFVYLNEGFQYVVMLGNVVGVAFSLLTWKLWIYRSEAGLRKNRKRSEFHQGRFNLKRISDPFAKFAVG
jgi:hypothetical protein